MASFGRRMKASSEPASLAAAPISEQPGDQVVSVRQPQQHRDRATSCLPLRQKTATLATRSEQRWQSPAAACSSEQHQQTPESKAKITTQFMDSRLQIINHHFL
uniref:Uncharacterized protein n=1 Tax=Solanum lycopersicum TaxID=4081 RepID=A0A3Q7JAR5_SOLLC